MSVLNPASEPVATATPAPTYRCRHLHTDGRQCGSPSLRQEHFCYYHHTTRVPAPRPPEHRSISDMAFDLPIPEDRTAINYAIGEVLRRVAAMHIEFPTARLLLYGLSVASANLTRQEKAQEKAAKAASQAIAQPVEAPVTDLVMDPHDGPLAPAAPGQRPSVGHRSITPGRLRLETRETNARKIEADFARIEAAQKSRTSPPEGRTRARTQPPTRTHTPRDRTPPQPLHPPQTMADHRRPKPPVMKTFGLEYRGGGGTSEEPTPVWDR